LLNRFIFHNSFGLIEKVHVIQLIVRNKFKIFLHFIIVWHFFSNEANNKLYRTVMMILFEILNISILVFLRRKFFFQKCFVLSNTFRNWNLSDRHSLVICLVNTLHNKTSSISSFHLSLKSFPTNRNISFFSIESIFHQCYDIFNFVRLYICAPSSSNTFCPIDKNHRKNRKVIIRLNVLIFLMLIVDYMIIFLFKDISS